MNSHAIENPKFTYFRNLTNRYTQIDIMVELDKTYENNLPIKPLMDE